MLAAQHLCVGGCLPRLRAEGLSLFLYPNRVTDYPNRLLTLGSVAIPLEQLFLGSRGHCQLPENCSRRLLCQSRGINIHS